MASPIVPRGLERYALGEKREAEGERWDATDRDRGQSVIVTRVAFGASRRSERDAMVERVRRLFSVVAPSLITAVDAGPWEDDAFVIEERVIEPRPLSEMGGDARERAIAAQQIAEGLATLHAAGWSLRTLDIVADAYRRPKMAIAREVIPATDETKREDLAAAERVIATLVPGAPRAESARDLARAIAIPSGEGGSPLVGDATPPRSSYAGWIVVALALVVVLALFALTR